ncbi:MAG TPA: DUF4169 family protein [Stellaceae bacterium]
MSEVVNLNRFRKTKQREEEKREAAANRTQHGRTKAEREKEAADQKRRDALLDGNKIND